MMCKRWRLIPHCALIVRGHGWWFGWVSRGVGVGCYFFGGAGIVGVSH